MEKVQKKYNIIYADPAWKYNDRRENGRWTKFWGWAMSHYDTMTIPQLKELDIDSISADNCVLFMWVTFPLIKEWIDVLEAWWFKYKTLWFSWIKTNKDWSPFFWVWSYAKSNCEVCLMWVKGKVGRMTKDEWWMWVTTPPEEKVCTVSNKISSAVISPREKHSKKPDIVRERIVAMFWDIPRIELFAREQKEWFDVWWNEVESDINLTINNKEDGENDR